MDATVLKIIAIALVAAVLVTTDVIPFGTRVILLGALAVGGIIWLTPPDADDEPNSDQQDDSGPGEQK